MIPSPSQAVNASASTAQICAHLGLHLSVLRFNGSQVWSIRVRLSDSKQRRC